MNRKITITVFSIFLVLLLLDPVQGKTQRVGDDCNYSKNCQSYADGVGPAWAGGRITCAVEQNGYPEKCGSGDGNRGDFYGTCKAVGTISATEYGCECGVHKGDCPQTSPFSRIFWPQNWLSDAWKQVSH